MILPISDNLKAKISLDNPDHHQRLESLKEILKTECKAVNRANRNSHLNNKRLCDRRAKLREFNVGDLIYLFTPAKKPGLSKKFRPKLSGSYKIVTKISELNYEIAGQNDKRQIVHVNRLKQHTTPQFGNPDPGAKPRASKAKILERYRRKRKTLESDPSRYCRRRLSKRGLRRTSPLAPLNHPSTSCHIPFRKEGSYISTIRDPENEARDAK